MNTNKSISRNCFCSLLIYAKIFDFYLSQGIIPNQKYNPKSNIHYDVTYMNENEINEQNERLINENFYRNFLEFNELYQKYVVQQYMIESKMSLENDVKNLLHYGIYCNVEILKKILLGKYQGLSKSEYYKDYIESVKKN